MNAKKFFQSLQFRLIAIVLVIFIVSNVIIVSVALGRSTASTSKTVSNLLDAVTDSAAGKIKGETEKQDSLPLELLQELLQSFNIQLHIII